jgi:hypothetical protein
VKSGPRPALALTSFHTSAFIIMVSSSDQSY